MILIIKNAEPQSLKNLRNTPGADFDSMSASEKEDLRRSLLQEQGYLCAYCMKRIYNEGTTKIDHYAPRNKENELSYHNLLAVCSGNQTQRDCKGKVDSRRFTCDSMKHNKILHIDPQNFNDMKTIKYDFNGKIISTNTDYNDELNQILNLNDENGWLIENRKAAITSVRNKISNIESEQDVLKELKSLKKKFDSKNADGQYVEYVGILRWYIERHIRKHSK